MAARDKKILDLGKYSCMGDTSRGNFCYLLSSLRSIDDNVGGRKNRSKLTP